MSERRERCLRSKMGYPTSLQKGSRSEILGKERGSWRPQDGVVRSQFFILSTVWLYTSPSSTRNWFSPEEWKRRGYSRVASIEKSVSEAWDKN